MSEKGKEKEMSAPEPEEEVEREVVDHWSHQHPLTLVKTRGRKYQCYGCEQQFSSGEQAYGCSIKGCQSSKLLHEECVAMAREIQHPLHPQHTLIQSHTHSLSLFDLWHRRYCGFCGKGISFVTYRCASSGCKFTLHLRCAQGGGVMDAAAEDGVQRRAMIRHPSHPNHELKLWRRNCSFNCDACGTT